jgi:hypothetical protein
LALIWVINKIYTEVRGLQELLEEFGRMQKGE